MSKKRKPAPGTAGLREKEIIIPIPYRLPIHTSLQIKAHNKWLDMLNKAEALLNDDTELQKKAAKGLMIKERKMPPEVLGRLYAQYCDLINQMYDAYLNNVQLQKLPYMQEIVSVFVKRMYELRNELVHIIVNDYIYVDMSLRQILKTPFDIQVVVPYHYAKDSRPGSIEELLQQMWQDALKRKIRAARPKKIKVIRSPVGSQNILDDSKSEKAEDEERIEIIEVDEEEVEEEAAEEEETYSEFELTEDHIRIVIIQRMERYRKFYRWSFLEKCNRRRLYFARKDILPPTPEMMKKAADVIHTFYRRFMAAKREHVIRYKKDVILGLQRDYDRRPLKFRDENEKLYERRRQTRKKLDIKYQEQIEKERARLLFWGKDAQVMEDITKEIRDWFEEWFYGYDYFPLFPYELEGGTLLVVKGQYPTIDEQKEEDEKYRRATMGKTKEQLKDEKKQAKIDAEYKKEVEREKLKKEKLAFFKAKCSPLTDMGYKVQTSEVSDPMTEILRRYRMAWSIYDKWPMDKCGDIIYGFMKPVITEDVMAQLHIECRPIVDQMMRLELKVFTKAQQMMFLRVSKLWPKRRQRKKPKPQKVPIPFVVDQAKIDAVRRVFDMEIISKPTVRLDDIIGDLSFGAYEANIDDPWAKFPPPGYGDVKRRLVLSCAFGSGLEPGAQRNKSVMLMGLERNGKTFLADCVAGEMNAVKFDISPEVFSAKLKKPNKMLGLVFMAAKIFQPSVIFCKNIERIFYKTIPPADRVLKANRMKAPLTKMLKALPSTEKVIFIATCSNPLLAKQKPMFKMFNEVIVVPKPDYGSLQKYFFDSFQKIKSMPRDFCVQGLARCMQGIGFGQVMEVFDSIMTHERICRLNYQPLEQSEFIEYMIQNDIESVDARDYKKIMDLWLKYSPLKAEREEYQIINTKRASVYAKLAKIQADKEAKAAARKK